MNAVRYRWVVRTALICLAGIVLAGHAVPAAAQREDEIAQLRQAIADLQKRLDALEAQQRKEAEQKETAPPARSSVGPITMGGLLQTWYATDSRGPDTFRLRRMEMSFSGSITPRVSWRTMFDLAKPLSLNVAASGGTVTGVSPNQASRILQDMFVSYALTPRLTADVGQFKVPLSMEGLRSPADILTVERSIMNVLPARNGRMGDARDLGLQLRTARPRWEAAVGVFNDASPRQNDVDDNNNKAVVGRVAFRPIVGTAGTLQIGVSGARGRTAAAEVVRDRLGGELSYRVGPHILEAEVAEAKDGAPVVKGRGGYVTYAYSFSPGWQGVVRYDRWDPNTAVGGDAEHDWVLGANYYIRGRNARIQLNVVRKSIGAAAPAYLGSSRTLVLTNFQTAW
jgi:hypothetical protein